MSNYDKQTEGIKSLLVKSLPSAVNASNDKKTANHRENRNRDRLNALENYSFIYFNSPQMVTLMIFDIDYINGQNAVDVFLYMKWYMKYLLL